MEKTPKGRKTCAATVPSLHHSIVDSHSENKQVMRSLGVSSPPAHGLPNPRNSCNLWCASHPSTLAHTTQHMTEIEPEVDNGVRIAVVPRKSYRVCMQSDVCRDFGHTAGKMVGCWKNCQTSMGTCTSAIPGRQNSAEDAHTDNHQVLSSLGLSSSHAHGLPPKSQLVSGLCPKKP